ncbi:MAG: hypothetical protein BGO14_10985 [Chlamydiales bacterium 38-26]|nr:hypothetical protein [Chlamydiales bacterium]OJV11474.1 MAG: hypothetical protein BGO14_10985 [Chlamydiales bacterium 38-26]
MTSPTGKNNNNYYTNYNHPDSFESSDEAKKNDEVKSIEENDNDVVMNEVIHPSPLIQSPTSMIDYSKWTEAKEFEEKQEQERIVSLEKFVETWLPKIPHLKTQELLSVFKKIVSMKGLIYLIKKISWDGDAYNPSAKGRLIHALIYAAIESPYIQRTLDNHYHLAEELDKYIHYIIETHPVFLPPICNPIIINILSKNKFLSEQYVVLNFNETGDQYYIHKKVLKFFKNSHDKGVEIDFKVNKRPLLALLNYIYYRQWPTLENMTDKGAFYLELLQLIKSTKLNNKCMEALLNSHGKEIVQNCNALSLVKLRHPLILELQIKSLLKSLVLDPTAPSDPLTVLMKAIGPALIGEPLLNLFKQLSIDHPFWKQNVILSFVDRNEKKHHMLISKEIWSQSEFLAATTSSAWKKSPDEYPHIYTLLLDSDYAPTLYSVFSYLYYSQYPSYKVTSLIPQHYLPLNENNFLDFLYLAEFLGLSNLKKEVEAWGLDKVGDLENYEEAKNLYITALHANSETYQKIASLKLWNLIAEKLHLELPQEEEMQDSFYAEILGYLKEFSFRDLKHPSHASEEFYNRLVHQAPELSSLEIDRGSIPAEGDLSFLQKLQKLQTLHIVNVPSEDFKIIQSLPLQTLSISLNDTPDPLILPASVLDLTVSIDDFHKIDFAESTLHTLTLLKTSQIKEQILEKRLLKQLKKLKIEHLKTEMKISNLLDLLEALNHTSLKKLSIQSPDQNFYENLPPLSFSFVNLESLELDTCPCFNILTLTPHLKNLKMVISSHTHPSIIETLSNSLPGLENLELHLSQLNDRHISYLINILKEKKGLKTLKISGDIKLNNQKLLELLQAVGDISIELPRSIHEDLLDFIVQHSAALGKNHIHIINKS